MDGSHDKKLLRKLLDDLGRECEYDSIHYWSLQLDSGMVAEVRFVEPATLPEQGDVAYIVQCPCEPTGAMCMSSCFDGDGCPHDDGRCCELCAHYNGGRLTETCYHCSMLSHWHESELTDDEIEALTDDDIMPVDCSNCKNIDCDVYDEPCNECTDERYDVYTHWEPKD